MNVRVSNAKHALAPSGGAAQELTVATSVVQADALDESAKCALVSVKTNSVYVTFDWTDPVTSTAVGVLLAAGTNIWLSKAQIASAKFIQGSGAAKVRIEPMS